MKIVAGIGLLFFVYCLVQVLRRWNFKSGTEKALWFVVIAVGAGWCVGVLRA
jgi:hypothetical protein